MKFLSWTEIFFVLLAAMVLWLFGIFIAKLDYAFYHMDNHIDEIRFLDELNFRMDSLPAYKNILNKELSDFTVTDWWYYRNIRQAYLESLSVKWEEK